MKTSRGDVSKLTRTLSDSLTGSSCSQMQQDRRVLWCPNRDRSQVSRTRLSFVLVLMDAVLVRSHTFTVWILRRRQTSASKSSPITLFDKIKTILCLLTLCKLRNTFIPFVLTLMSICCSTTIGSDGMNTYVPIFRSNYLNSHPTFG